MLTKKETFIQAEIDGWKGEDGITIEKIDNDYLLVEHRKNKETGKITEEKTIVKNENVEFLWKIILGFAYETKYGYRYLVDKIIQLKHLDIDIDSWNGGSNRRSYYFPLYYHPIKIIEWQGKIKYFGDGSIKRIK